VYWNDPNELVDRLRLLLASQSAGNTGVSNEILSIFEELYESGITKKIPNV
jgi:ABC-type ATPase involved in cell division